MEVKDVNISIVGQGIEVKVMFLNPFKGYRDQLTLQIFSSSPLKIIDARGRGSGWGVTYFDRIKFRDDIDMSLSMIGAGNWPSLIKGLVKLSIVLLKTNLR